VLDPFAGGSVRGIVAGMLGLDYVGIELSRNQIEANREQAKRILLTGANGWAGKKGIGRVEWVEGDALTVETIAKGSYDLIFSCPPYGDLEVYSDDPLDISTMPHAAFLNCYRKIIETACKMLKPNRFACFVVGDYRDKQGFYRNFVSKTIKAFQDAGMKLYNEAILVTAVGSLAIRVGIQFGKFRKIGKTHQNCLVFYNGDPKGIVKEFPEIEVDDPEPDKDQVVVLSAPVQDEADNTPELTPIEEHGGYPVKRDDYYCIAGVRGGKVRTCWALAQGANGLVTAGSRQSPQVNIVAHIARRLGVPCRVHVPWAKGALTPELLSAQACGAEIVMEKPGYNSVIVSRASKDAALRGWTLIPFGMECAEAVKQTSAQVEPVPGVKRVVIPVGSGMSLAGLLNGLKLKGLYIPVLGVVVGADPVKRLDRFAPGWRKACELVPAGMDYHNHASTTRLGDLELDPVYEAKCLRFLKAGDLLWVVGIRESATSQSDKLES
jgi:1-aminocyclopropane-1-carboxylate deaminase/D-cysteine desulfhydrase-like pyridoxal-dependent ACC family enzyme